MVLRALNIAKKSVPINWKSKKKKISITAGMVLTYASLLGFISSCDVLFEADA